MHPSFVALGLILGCTTAEAACFRAAPLFENVEIKGVKVARPDLVGEIFRMTRYGKHLVRKLNRANGAIGVWGNELFELKGKAQTFYISREHIPGSPPFMDGSYETP